MLSLDSPREYRPLSFSRCIELNHHLPSAFCRCPEPNCRHSCRHRQRFEDPDAAIGRHPQRSIAIYDSCFLSGCLPIAVDRSQALPPYLPIAANAYSDVCRSLPIPNAMSTDRCQGLHRSLPIAANVCRSLQKPADVYRSLQRCLPSCLPIATDRYRSLPLSLISNDTQMNYQWIPCLPTTCLMENP